MAQVYGFRCSQIGYVTDYMKPFFVICLSLDSPIASSDSQTRNKR